MNYPRSKSIRWYWLTGKFLQFVSPKLSVPLTGHVSNSKQIFFTSLMVFMTEQYVTPTIRNSVHMVHASRNVVWMLLERILKLSVSRAGQSLTPVNSVTRYADSHVVRLALRLLFYFPLMVKHPR